MNILRKYLINSEDLQLVVLDATELVATSMALSEAWPPATIHLGQGLMSASLLVSILTKETEGKLSLQWSSNGPFGDLFIESQPSGKTRGTILNAQAAVQNMYAGMGPGKLQVRKNFRQQSQGIIRSQGDVCSDILHYLNQSEQRQCAMNLWVDMTWNDDNSENPVELKRAYGYLFEVLPSQNASEDQLKKFTWESRLEEMGSLSQWSLDESDPVASIAEKIADGAELKEILTQKIQFSCNCTEERAERALTLAVKQSGEPRSETETIKCEFCGKTYSL